MISTYPQSGAGHHLTSGSTTSARRSINSSYLRTRDGSELRNWRTSSGCRGSVQTGQGMSVLLSVISTVRYRRRHSAHDRCRQCDKTNRGKEDSGWGRAQIGHSTSTTSDSDDASSSSSTGSELDSDWTSWCCSRRWWRLRRPEPNHWRSPNKRRTEKRRLPDLRPSLPWLLVPGLKSIWWSISQV